MYRYICILLSFYLCFHKINYDTWHGKKKQCGVIWHKPLLEFIYPKRILKIRHGIKLNPFALFYRSMEYRSLKCKQWINLFYKKRNLNEIHLERHKFQLIFVSFFPSLTNSTNTSDCKLHRCYSDTLFQKIKCKLFITSVRWAQAVCMVGHFQSACWCRHGVSPERRHFLKR